MVLRSRPVLRPTSLPSTNMSAKALQTMNRFFKVLRISRQTLCYCKIDLSTLVPCAHITLIISTSKSKSSNIAITLPLFLPPSLVLISLKFRCHLFQQYFEATQLISLTLDLNKSSSLVSRSYLL